MPLPRLFHRRTQPESSAASSSRNSSDTDYVFPDSPSVYNIPAAAASARLRLPFRRKHTPNVTSDSGHDLPPPPSKSAVFAGLNRSLQSVQSLPNAPDTPARPSSSDTRTDKKSPGLFSWARERTKSKPPPPPSDDDPSSFHLKSFRHVRPDSPPQHPSPPPSDTLLLPPPRPRPRGDSVASDASQRISVAAFREAHARSRTNSPVPSFRPPSTSDTPRIDLSRKRASTLSPTSPDPPQLNHFVPRPRSDPSAPSSSSDESESEDDEDEDVDSDGIPIPNPGPKLTLNTPSPSVPVRQDPSSSRQPASSTLAPNAAPPSASALAATRSSSSHAPPRIQPNHNSDSSDSSHSDYEDMPLSDLVAPRRPQSAASNYSNSRPRLPSKPLIDISTLAGAPPLLTPILRHENSIKDFHNKPDQPDVEKDQPFSIPAVLALSSTSSPPISPSLSKHIPSKPSAVPDRRSSIDMPALPKSQSSDHDDDLLNAIRLVGALDTDRIVPTFIREREPPTSFTVLSRPHRQSTIDTSASPPFSPQLDMPPRQRASTIVNSPTQKDKSDTLSVLSTARSTASRTSSRVPPVPLIHSIPDSPSLKQDYKSGRSQSATRPPPANPFQTHSHPSPPTLMPQRPFASNTSSRGDSPAGSSTGDSSSGRAPFTPRDGSDVGVRSKDDVNSTLKPRGHAKHASVTFEDPPARGRDRPKTDLTDEQRTRERRRSEAKAALELGKIVNGRDPLGNESDDRARARNPTINVTTENGSMQPGWQGWQQPMATGMGPMVSPQFGNDPAFLAAHQRALVIAKQAYQMAVAQHAMQMAGEEWERGSNIGFGSAGSVYGGGSGGSVYGGSGGSVYGGGTGGSVYGGMAPMGMMSMPSMPSMGMLMPPNQWAARSSVAFPSATGSVYGMNSSQSEYGGGAGWGSRSVYGDARAAAPNTAASAYGGSSRPRASTGVASSSSSRPSGTPSGPGKGAVRGRPAPPSSWKSGR